MPSAQRNAVGSPASRTPLGVAVNLSTKIAIQTSLEKAARRRAEVKKPQIAPHETRPFRMFYSYASPVDQTFRAFN